jgi:hypothetical protein
MTLELDKHHDGSLIEHLAHDEYVDEVRLGGNLLLWIGGTIIGLVLLGFGIYNAPTTFGFLVMIAGGLLLGFGYAEVISRLPTLTHRWWVSLFLLLVASALVLGIIAMNANAAPVPPPNPDALLTPTV